MKVDVDKTELFKLTMSREELSALYFSINPNRDYLAQFVGDEDFDRDVEDNVNGARIASGIEAQLEGVLGY